MVESPRRSDFFFPYPTCTSLCFKTYQVKQKKSSVLTIQWVV
ncbi:hypothetical protein NC651_011413 [Populus alba x Populus x berolinensis]|nr:hypothetical protein NC651_011413 [Populus alba x Populus x berolinensis]